MPELPEVQTVVNSLLPKAVGARITAVDVVRPDFVQPPGTDLRALLLGRSVQQIHRRGKRMIFTLEDGNHFLIHLGMSGRLTHHPPGSVRLPHTHLVLALTRPDCPVELHLSDPRRFGEVRWLGPDAGDSGLGVEPQELTPATLSSILQDSRRPIKNLLLDQSAIAGLGNIYVDESLFAAGVHPLTPANVLDRNTTAQLCRAIKAVLRKALKHRGSTLRDYVDAEGGKGAFQNLHQVYARDGQPCRKCGQTLQRIVLGGRSCCFCAQCQPKLPIT